MTYKDSCTALLHRSHGIVMLKLVKSLLHSTELYIRSTQTHTVLATLGIVGTGR